MYEKHIWGLHNISIPLRMEEFCSFIIGPTKWRRNAVHTTSWFAGEQCKNGKTTTYRQGMHRELWRNCWSTRSLLWLWGWLSWVSFLWMTLFLFTNRKFCVFTFHVWIEYITISKRITRQQKSEKVPMVCDRFQYSHSCHQPKLLYRLRRKRKLYGGKKKKEKKKGFC